MKQPAIKRQFPLFSEQKTAEDLIAYIKEMTSSQWQLFVIRERANEQAIGFIMVAMRANSTAITHHALGDRRWWGKGVVHEARAAVIELLFAKGIHKVIGRPRATSRGAIDAYRDQGFVQEGFLREHYQKGDGTYEDAIAFGLLKREWDFKAASQLPKAVQARLARKAKRSA